jgi:DNA (cytosine-5)-methyltransferase 1
MSSISLFSGMGGDSYGLQCAGYPVIAYSEKEKYIQKTHDINFPNSVLIGGGDIVKTPTADFESFRDRNIGILFAGFPCQGFSSAGKKDQNDVRNTLFREFLRATVAIKPQYIIGENVKGLLSRRDKDNELYIDVINREFEAAGYDIIYQVVKADQYGVPQKRERLIILGARRDLNKQLSFPLSVPLSVSLINIVKFDLTDAIIVPPDVFDFSTIPTECVITDIENSDMPTGKPHPFLVGQMTTNDKSYAGKTYETLFSFGKRGSPIHCEIVDIRNPSKTIICTYERQPRLFVVIRNQHGYYLRCFTPDELKQIQGFPADYIVSGNKKEQIIQIGNAVPPPLIRAIAEHLSDV